MAHRGMIDGVMKKLMRGIKMAAEPINQHNCAHSDTGAISNTGQCTGSRWGEGWGEGLKGGEGDRHEGRHCNASQCQERVDDVLWLLKEHRFILYAEYEMRTFLKYHYGIL